MKAIKRQPPFPLRLERDLKSWLQVKAKENKRSLNSEVAFVLERYRKEAQHA